MSKTTYQISGMHCKSCEILIEDEIQKIKGVTKVNLNHQKGTATVFYNNLIDISDISSAVEKAGYHMTMQTNITNNDIATNDITTNNNPFLDFGIAALIILIIYLLTKDLSFTNFLSSLGKSTGNYLSILLLGLTAGVSTCMAMVGGLVISVTAKYSQTHPDLSSKQRIIPQIYFNLGRIVGFFVLGGLIGLLGSIFQLSTTIISIFTLVIASYMFFLGLQLSGLFPKLDKFKISLPKLISRKLHITDHKDKPYSPLNSFILGSLTFFLPCGFTQAVQLIAIASGNFLSGAVVMAVFAIGTLPGLFTVGGIFKLIKKNHQDRVFRFTAVIVIVMALFNAKNAIYVLNINQQSTESNSADVNNKQITTSQKTINNKQETTNSQTITMEQRGNGYFPNSLTVKVNQPVRWIINSTNQYSCATSFIVPALNIRTNLKPGENVIDFTPTKTGQIRFSCSMGMYNGLINVVN